MSSRSPSPLTDHVCQHADSVNRETLAALLPSRYRNLRDKRYRGEGFDISLRSLSPVDQEHIRVLYGFAKDLYVAWIVMQEQPDWEALRTRIVSFLSPPLSLSVKELGRESLAACAPGDAETSLGKVMHDIRGGALMPLQLYAHMAQEEADPVQLRSAVFLARDQAKMMRNILPDLDPEVRGADEAEKPHYIRAVVEKWDRFQFERPGQAPGQVSVNCSYDGLLASCCLEASAVDRIVYNYINNAIRFTAGPQIRMEILPVGEHVVRWLVANPVTTDQAAWLQDRTRGDLSSLFRGGITRGGHGLGLSNCADFVAAAFGLHDIDEALEGKYLGAVVRDGCYVAWAHWPSLYTQQALPGGQAAAHPVNGSASAL